MDFVNLHMVIGILHLTFSQLGLGYLVCPQGTYFLKSKTGRETYEKCKECPPGTFMDSNDHRRPSCMECTHFNEFDPLIQKVKECSPTEDTKIKCEKLDVPYKHNDRCNCLASMNIDRENSTFQYLGSSRTYPCSHSLIFCLTLCCLKEYLDPNAGLKGPCDPFPEKLESYFPNHTKPVCLDNAYRNAWSKPHVTVKRQSCDAQEHQIGRSCENANYVFCWSPSTIAALGSLLASDAENSHYASLLRRKAVNDTQSAVNQPERFLRPIQSDSIHPREDQQESDLRLGETRSRPQQSNGTKWGLQDYLRGIIISVIGGIILHVLRPIIRYIERRIIGMRCFRRQ